MSDDRGTLAKPAFSEEMAQKGDANLLAMFNSPADWTPDALEAARGELQRRNIDTGKLVTAVPPPLDLPQPSYGALVWGAFLLLVVFSGSVYWLQVACSVVSVGVCVAWFVASRRRTRHGILRRFLGYIAFGFGSALPLSAALLFPLGMLKKTPLDVIGLQFVFALAAAAGSIAIGFFLVFRVRRTAQEH